MKHISLKIIGHVQGVFFRASTIEVAKEYQLAGIVQNQSDGSVFIDAEGNEENLKKFVAWCHHGPTHARVTSVIVTEGKLKGYTNFSVK